jgi:hypothetical protein
MKFSKETGLFAILVGLAYDAVRDFAAKAATAVFNAALDKFQEYNKEESPTRHASDEETGIAPLVEPCKTAAKKMTEVAPLAERVETSKTRGDASAVGRSVPPAPHHTFSVLLPMVPVFFAGAFAAYGVMRVVLNRRSRDISFTKPTTADAASQTETEVAHTDERPLTTETLLTHTHPGTAGLVPVAAAMYEPVPRARGKAGRNATEWSL